MAAPDKFPLSSFVHEAAQKPPSQIYPVSRALTWISLMDIEFHKKALKVWLILIVASAISFGGSATIVRFMGGPEDVFKYVVDNVVSFCPKEEGANPERMALTSLELEAIGKKAMIGKYLNLGWIMLLQYVLSMVLVKYLSRSVIYVGGKEIDV